MSGSLTAAMDLLSDTETTLTEQQKQIADLLNETSASKEDLKTLEELQQNQFQTFAEQSRLLEQSETSSKRWKRAALFGIPAALAAGLLAGLLIR
jgi:UDP-N-acetylglucosamine pyrophosphorylase